jgi:hypothetical protein
MPPSLHGVLSADSCFTLQPHREHVGRVPPVLVGADEGASQGGPSGLALFTPGFHRRFDLLGALEGSDDQG